MSTKVKTVPPSELRKKWLSLYAETLQEIETRKELEFNKEREESISALAQAHTRINDLEDTVEALSLEKAEQITSLLNKLQKKE